MLARPALRTASKRAFRPPSRLPKAFPASLNTTSKWNYPAVPVINYKGGERTEGAIDIKTDLTGPVTPFGDDEQKTAKPLDPNVYSQLTPTLHRFTLRNKVAVVTGYAI